MCSAWFLVGHLSKAGSGLGYVVLGLMSVEMMLEVMVESEVYKREWKEKRKKWRWNLGKHTSKW